MNNQENKLVPELRFPEFLNDGEWKIQELSEICDVFRGSPFSKADISEDGKNNCIHYGELFTKYTETIFKTISKTNKHDGFRSKNGDILMPSSDVTPNGLAKATAIMIDDIVLGGDMNVLRPKVDFNSIFLSYLLNHSKEEIIKLVSGTTVKHIYPSQIINCQLPIIDSLPEQQKIADCLSSLDELLTAHTDKLETLKTYKKGLMQNLFPQEGEKVPKFRFAAFEKDGEWKEKKLGELIELKGRIGYRGYTLEDIVSKGQGAISMSPSNIDAYGNLNFAKSTYITWKKYEESPEIMLHNNFTVLVKTGSTFGKVAFVKNLNEKTTINPQLVVLKPKKIDSFFLYLIVSNSSVQKQINETVVGGAIPTLSQDNISKFELQIPDDKEQQKIAATLSSLDDLITEQSNKIEQLKSHKKGLMQGLFPKVSN